VHTTTGNRVFGCLKGASDGGLYIPHKERRFPGFKQGDDKSKYDAKVHRDRIFGVHVDKHMGILKKEGDDSFKRQFSKWAATLKDAGADSLEKLYTKIQAEIRKNPDRVKAQVKTNPDRAHKKFRPKRMSKPQRKERAKDAHTPLKKSRKMVSFKSSTSILIALSAFVLVLMIAPAMASRAHHGFFQALSEEQKEQVSEILHSGKTKAEIKEQLRHWVSGQPKETQDAFNAAEKAQEARRQRIHGKRQQMLSRVSSASKDLDSKIKAIYEDQKLTKKQTCEKVRDLIKAASEQTKKELKLKDLDCDE